MEIRKSIMTLAYKMEEKLEKCDNKKGKNGWVSIEPKKLLEDLLGEVIELCNEFAVTEEEQDRQKIISECVDISNFSMMIVDVMEERRKKRCIVE